MVRPRLLFNSSVKKPLFDSTQKKLMMGDLDGNDCEDCDAGHTPKKIKATFSEWISCANGCYWHGGDPEDYWWCAVNNDPAAEINGNSYILTQDDTIPCLWKGDFIGDWAHLCQGTSGCAPEDCVTPYDFTNFHIEVKKNSDTEVILHNIRFEVGGQNAYLFLPAGYEEWPYSPDIIKCIEFEQETVLQECTSAPNVCYGGKITVEEI